MACEYFATIAKVLCPEWTNQHPGFKAELNQRRWELWNGATDRLRLLIPKALDTVAAALDTGSVPRLSRTDRL